MCTHLAKAGHNCNKIRLMNLMIYSLNLVLFCCNGSFYLLSCKLIVSFNTVGLSQFPKTRNASVDFFFVFCLEIF